MPEGVRCPAIGIVAGVALQAGDKVIARLPGRLRTIMAARTRAGHAVVVEACWQPRTCGVAGVALRTGLNMIYRLAGGG